ncbi:MAG: hypothetical protein M3Q23_12565 [Actinomycetota bacterium]|nr:hypothetical protein [Actinomycetota bacterium]
MSPGSRTSWLLVISMLMPLSACSGSSTPVSTPHSPATAAPTPETTPSTEAIPATRRPDVLDLSFVDPDHGYALVMARMPTGMALAIERTADGGRTWDVGRALWDPGIVEHVVFATRRLGWAFEPGLWVTHDGGRSWRGEVPGGSVAGLGVAGRSVWALLGRCDGPLGCRPGRFRLSNDAGHSWRTVPLPSGIHDDFVVDFQRIGSAGWILTSDYVVGEDRSTLLETHDGGATWSETDSPCMRKAKVGDQYVGPFIFEEHVSAIDASRVWLLCLTEPAAAMNDGNLFLSVDGGRRWHHSAIAPSGALVLLAATTIRGGWVAQDSGAYALRHFSTIRGSGRRSMAIDRGHWVAVRFVDPTHGWAAAGDTVYRTTDGRYWRAVRLVS